MVLGVLDGDGHSVAFLIEVEVFLSKSMGGTPDYATEKQSSKAALRISWGEQLVIAYSRYS